MQKTASQSTIVLGFSAILILMLLLAAVSITLISQRSSDIDQLIAENDRKQQLIIEMRRASRERTVSLQKMVILSDPFSQDDELQKFWSHGAAFIHARDELIPGLHTPEELDGFSKVMELVRINAPRQNTISEDIIAGKKDRAKTILEEDIIPRQMAIYDSLTKLLELEEEIGHSAVANAKRGYSSTLNTLLILLAVTLISSWLIAYYVTRKIRKTERKLAEERELAQVTLHSIGDAVITTDQHGFIDQLNNVAETLIGYSDTEAHNKPLEIVIPLTNEFTGGPIPNPVLRVLNGEGIISSAGETILINKEGNRFAIEFTAAPILDDGKRIKGAILVFRDVTEMRSLSNELAYRARHDPLTGLNNRVELEEELTLTLAQIRRNSERHAWLCYLDLDQFKVINDTCGHAAGDELLKQVASILQHRLRSTDFISRLGGDEFALILADCDEPSALALINEIHSSINSIRFAWHNKSFPVSASFGLIDIRPDSGRMQDLLSAADAACYIAKEQGRNRIHVHRMDDNLTTRQNKEMQMVHLINHAIEHGEFELYFQNIIPLSTQTSGTHFEVLLRMKAYDGELVLPGAFIPAAERYNLMSKVDRWVVRNTLQKNEFSQKPGMTLSINISAQSLSEDSFLEFVMNELENTEIPTSHICFEITETTAISNLTTALHFIITIKSFGCLFSLDDFGSGLSSFGYLKQLPVDFIKIDGSFVRDIFKDPMNIAMIQSIVNIARVINVSTIAEYATNQEILEKVRELGVDYAQGFSISEPMPLTELLSDTSNQRLAARQQ